MKYNVLVTAIGSFSASTVVNSLRGNSKINDIYGCDIHPKEWHNVSKYFNDVLKAPYASEESDYLYFIQKIISKYQIDIVIPLTDIEVDFFNKKINLFKDIIITIGNSDFIKIARNKELLNLFLKENNYLIPCTYVFNQLNENIFPLIGKPKNGRSSEGVEYFTDFKELSIKKDYSNYIFQEFINGEIITVDVIRNSKTSNIVIIPRKELIRSSNGAGMTVEMFYDQELIDYTSQISQLINADGAYNIEFIKSNEKYYLIDINPRFSAGIGFTFLMGYDIVNNMLNTYINRPLENVVNYKSMIIQKKMVEVINKIY